MAKALTPYPVQVENAMFTFARKSAGEEIRGAACAHVANLCNMVLSLLAENDRCIV